MLSDVHAHNRKDVHSNTSIFLMQWRWCALHLRIILNKLTARATVFRCMSTQINGMEVYHTSMNKYIYRVRFVLLYYDKNYAQI